MKVWAIRRKAGEVWQYFNGFNFVGYKSIQIKWSYWMLGINSEDEIEDAFRQIKLYESKCNAEIISFDLPE